MEELLQKMAVAQMEFWSAVEKISSQNATITDEQYQSEHRKRIFANLRDRINNKRVNLVVVADWVGKSVDYCRQNIFYRGHGNNTESRWAVDVVVFLCREWGISVPSWCKDQQEKFGLRA